jgi:hypothetical protein
MQAKPRTTRLRILLSFTLMIYPDPATVSVNWC